LAGHNGGMMKLTRHMRQFRCNQEGAALIEFVFIVPMLLWLIMGILEYGIIFHLRSLATNAGNEAARLGKTGYLYGSEGSREALIEDTVEQYLEPWMGDTAPVQVESESYGAYGSIGRNGTRGTGSGGQVVLYEVTYYWTIVTPFLGTFLRAGDRMPITARALIKNEEF
jgi:Flp pilus assembly protein TadG